MPYKTKLKEIWGDQLIHNCYRKNKLDALFNTPFIISVECLKEPNIHELLGNNDEYKLSVKD